jgi:DNA-binding CsgD family transcriptional regulator
MWRSELHDFLRGSAEPGVVITAEEQIDFLNPAAEDLFQVTTEQATGLPCHKLIRSRDHTQAPFCRPNCLVLKQALHGPPVPPIDLEMEPVPGVSRWFNLSTHPFGGPLNRLCIHFLRDVDVCHRLRAAAESLVTEFAAMATSRPATPLTTLTQQERAILACLVRGSTTQAIAADLNISPATVRNHVQHLLRKLDAHTRMEVVIRALREHLV